MAVPKRRTSRSATRTRRAHHSLSKPNLSACPNCQELIPSHQVCPKCGHYKGEQVIDTNN